MPWFHRLLVLWMTAAAVHLPMPVGDGDDLKSGQALLIGQAPAACWDLDFILLGCDPPDDCDDGPVDDDPESSSGSPLGSYVAHLQLKAPDLLGGERAASPGTAAPHDRALADDRQDHRPHRLRSCPRRSFSFARACQLGRAAMRC